MRILFVQKRPVFPADSGGKVRTLNIIRHLAQWHDVTYLCNVQPGEERFLPAMEDLPVRVVTVPWREAPRGGARFYRDLALNLGSRYPFNVNKDYDPRLRRRAAELLGGCVSERGDRHPPARVRSQAQSQHPGASLLFRRPFDLVICDFVQMARNVVGLAGPPKLLFQHNVEAEIFQRHATNGGGWLRRKYMRLQWRKMRRFEAEAGRRFDAVVAVSERDREIFERDYGWRHVRVIDTAVDTEYFSPNVARLSEPDSAGAPGANAKAARPGLPRSTEGFCTSDVDERSIPGPPPSSSRWRRGLTSDPGGQPILASTGASPAGRELPAGTACSAESAFHRDEPGGEVADRVVFVGSMDWLPNTDGVKRFVREIWPQARKARPAATFQIVGRSPDASVRRLAGIEGVEVTGSVPDVRPYLAEAAVVVVPLYAGGGTRLKIFEAMAMEKAVVSTSLGAEGLKLTPGVHVELADDDRAFAGRVVELLSDDDRRRQLARSGCEYVRRNFAAETVARQFEAICHETAGRQPVGEGARRQAVAVGMQGIP
ncbi:MAG TPA: glycosyltransferase [Planctomycetaceae bacterium]|nr:glycosyltransferase [Planctomycetaceae bacterium]